MIFLEDRKEEGEVVSFSGVPALFWNPSPDYYLWVPGLKGQKKVKTNPSPADNPTLSLRILLLFGLETEKHTTGTSVWWTFSPLLSQELSEAGKRIIIMPILQMRNLSSERIMGFSQSHKY